MAFACGSLKWTSDKFWHTTFYELSCAYIGWCVENGSGPYRVGDNGWSDSMIEEHKRETERLKKLFPDGNDRKPKRTKAEKRNG